MSFEKPIMDHSVDSTADLSDGTSAFKAMKQSGADVILATVAGERVLGPLRNDPGAAESAAVGILGINKFELGGTVAVGDPMITDAAAAWIKGAFGDFPGAVALEAGVSGDIIAGVLTPNSDPAVAQNGEGLMAQGMARAVYDFAADGGASGVINLGAQLPDNAIILSAWYEVATTLTSAGDNATVSLGVLTDDVAGILAAVAIDDGGNPWDAGFFDGIPDGTAANITTKTTAAARELIMTIAVEDLTAGKFTVFAEYVIGA